MEQSQTAEHVALEHTAHSFPSSENPAAREDRAESEDYQMKEFIFIQDQSNTSIRTNLITNEEIHAGTAPKMYKVFQRGVPMNEWPELSKEDYIAYWNGIDAFRMKEARKKLCGCPRSKIRKCDGDCVMCPYYVWDKFDYLDAPVHDDEGNEDNLMNRLVDDNSHSPENVSEQRMLAEAIGEAVDTLTDEEWLYYALWDLKYSYSEIAIAFGLSSKQLASYRLGKIFKKLRLCLETWN